MWILACSNQGALGFGFDVNLVFDCIVRTAGTSLAASGTVRGPG